MKSNSVSFATFSHHFIMPIATFVAIASASAVAETRSLRLVSAPDLINADIEYRAPRGFDMDETDPDYAARRQVIIDARTAAGQSPVPGYPEQSDSPHPHDVNVDGILSIQEGYRGGMQDMLEHIAAERPDAFLSSGDLIDGEWAVKPGKAFTNASLADRQQHVRDQGDIYYDAYFDNFRDAGYDGPIFGVIGDHEIGDNNWGSDKIQLVPTYFEVYREKMIDLPETVAGDGAYVDAPAGREGRWWAKQMGNVLLMGIETFDIRYNGSGQITAIVTDSAGTKKILMPQDHLDWIESTLQTADEDPSVEHIIVMGHSPFDVSGVRTASSSNLRIGGGTSSQLWQLFETYGVTLYLAGEVHAVSGFKQNGVTQLVTAGNQFSSAQSNYLVLDVYSDRILLTLKEAYKHINGFRSDASDPINDDNSKSAEWRTRHPYTVVGTATLYTGGTNPALVEETGQFASFVVDNDDGTDPTSIPPLVITPDPEPTPLESTAVRSSGIQRLNSVGLGSAASHPGVALMLEPAQNSVVLFGFSKQWTNPSAIDPVLINGRFHELQPLDSNDSQNLSTAVYGVDVGVINERQNVTIGGSFLDGAGVKTRANLSYAVQLQGATLAGVEGMSARGNTSPVSVSFGGKDEGAFLFAVGGHNAGGTDLKLSDFFDDSVSHDTTRNGYFRAGSGFFDTSAATDLTWMDNVGSLKGVGLSAVSVNASPVLRLEPNGASANLKFSWHSALGTEPEIQSTTDLSSGIWNPIEETPILTGERYETEIEKSESAEFFRFRP